MDRISLRLKPVYSQLAEPETEIALADGTSLHLAQHQADTLAAFNDPDIDLIFNTAMTGDGKTLAAYLPVLQHGRRALAAYPTNELIRDQVGGLKGWLGRFGQTSAFHEMSGAEITRLMDEHKERSRADEVRRLLDQNDVVLTNPDLFHLLMSYNYGWGQRRELVHTVQSSFHYYIFDEFHVFGPPQVIAVANIINAIAVERRNQGPESHRKYLFLSATPQPLLQRMLERTGLRVKTVAGQYQDEEGPDVRRILTPCTLILEPLDADRRTEAWVLDHTAELLDFYRAYPHSKGAIIVNSVATARRLVAQLKPDFEAAGLRVSENTGLTNRAARAASFAADLLVGTQTIDVGVDFHINLLIFEASSAAEFLQRFGRLGRHAGYIAADKREIPFAPESYRAYALCPRFICARIAQQVGLDPQNDGELAAPLDRPWFSREVINEVYPNRQEFTGYAKRWGLLQAAPHILGLPEAAYKSAPDIYGEQREALVEQLARSFDTKPANIWGAVSSYRKLAKEDGREGRRASGGVLLRELANFRGTSLSCGVWDTTDGALKTYGLLYLLANSEFVILTETAFMAEVARRGEPEYDYRYQLFYLKVLKYPPERDTFTFSNPGLDLTADQAVLLNQAQALVSFRVENLKRQNRDEINRRLSKERLVCTITAERRTPADLKRLLNLAPLFPIHQLQDATGENYCVAFGQAALLLDSLLWWRKNEHEPDAIFDFIAREEPRS